MTTPDHTPGLEDLIERVARAMHEDRRDRAERIMPRTWENLWADELEDYRSIARAALASANVEGPVPMLLFCPKCGLQHIDAPDERTPDWTNPPHKSHLCHGCGCIWRPADVPTEGVKAIATTGKADTWKPPLNYLTYALVRLSGPRAVERVHRLVAEAFVPNPDTKPSVNHLNNDRADNRAVNLEWCTQRENIAHAARQGRLQRDHWIGKRSPNSSLTDDQVRLLRATYAAGGISLEEVGRRFGISKRAAGRCVNRETYADVQ